MRLIRFLYKGNPEWAIGEEDKILVLDNPPYLAWDVKQKIEIPTGIKLLAPGQPSKIVLVGLYYKDHAQELGMPLLQEPIIFLKPSSAWP